MTYYEKHQDILKNAIKAVKERSFFAQYPEHPKAYSPELAEAAVNNYNDMLNHNFSELLQDGESAWVGAENSPYTQEPLGVKYPKYETEELVNKAQKAFKSWKKISPKERAGILVEALEHVKNKFFEIAHATMHTTGQSFMMSFQASGPHANDRALEAIATALMELEHFPDQTMWEKNMGKFDIKVNKEWRAIPKGVSLAIGVSTFPVWNTVPGIFASLITGNTVICKPHPLAILPMAIFIAEAQKAFKECGVDPNILQLTADEPSAPITKELAEHPAVKLIDYTGGSAFGDYVESLEDKGKVTFTEKAGVNSVILDSVTKLEPVLQNLSFSVSLYSGQMCTAPQNFFIPKDGIKVGDEQMSYDEVVEKLLESIKGLVNHPKMGAGTLGAIQNAQTCDRVDEASKIGGKLLMESSEIKNEEFPKQRSRTPMVIELDSSEKKVFSEELFGPIILIVKTENTNESINIVKQLIADKGAISCSAYTTDSDLKERIKEEMEEVFAPVSFNYTGPIWVNQNAAFSDFHLTGGNKAGNASFADPNFVNKRFVWVGHREVVA